MVDWLGHYINMFRSSPSLVTVTTCLVNSKHQTELEPTTIPSQGPGFVKTATIILEKINFSLNFSWQCPQYCTAHISVLQTKPCHTTLPAYPSSKPVPLPVQYSQLPTASVSQFLVQLNSVTRETWALPVCLSNPIILYFLCFQRDKS